MWQEQQKLQTSHQVSVTQCSHTVYVLLNSELSERLFLPLISVMPTLNTQTNYQFYLNSFRELRLPVTYYIRDAVYLNRIFGITKLLFHRGSCLTLYHISI